MAYFNEWKHLRRKAKKCLGGGGKKYASVRNEGGGDKAVPAYSVSCEVTKPYYTSSPTLYQISPTRLVGPALRGECECGGVVWVPMRRRAIPIGLALCVRDQ